MKRLITFIIVWVLCDWVLSLFAGKVFGQDSLSFKPSAATGKDASVVRANPTTNYGSIDQLYAQSYNASWEDNYFFISFNGFVSSLPINTTIDSAIFVGTVENNANSPQIYARAVDPDSGWAEGTLTWLDTVSSSTPFSDTITITDNVRYRWNVTEYVDSAYAGVWSDTLGLMFRELTTQNATQTYAYFASSDNVTAASHPELIVYYHLPSSAALTGIIPKVRNSTIRLRSPNGTIEGKVVYK